MPEVRDPIRFIDSMRSWRSIAVWMLPITVIALIEYPPIAFIPLVVLTASTTLTLTYMTRAAANEAGTRYAAMHFLLALALLPVLFLGVFVVTRLVESDLSKWRSDENQGH